jgi:hypothetical protein
MRSLILYCMQECTYCTCIYTFIYIYIYVCISLYIINMHTAVSTTYSTQIARKIIDLLLSSVLPHSVSWYDACEVSPPMVVVSDRCWLSAVRVVAHAVVVERRSVPISKD